MNPSQSLKTIGMKKDELCATGIMELEIRIVKDAIM
jgi:hypothetical protein